MGGQAQSVAIPKRWPMVTTSDNRNEIFTNDSRLVNAYAEKDENTGEWIVQKRIGLQNDSGDTPFASPATIGRGLGMYNWNPLGAQSFANNGDLYAMWSFTDNPLAACGLFKNGSLFASGFSSTSKTKFIETRGFPAYLCFVSPGNGMNYTDGSNPPVDVPVSFPTANSYIVGIAYLNGFIYMMNSAGEIVNNNVADIPVNWDPTNVIIARSSPGIGVALAKQLTYIIAFKENSTEVFFDNGNPNGSPLSPVPEALSDYGCGATDSVEKIDELLFWLTTNQTISPQIAMMKSLKVSIVSTPPIERLLQQALRGVQSVFFSQPILGWSFKLSGHRFYGITIQSLNVTLVYDIDQELWYQWTDASGNFWNISGFSSDRTNRQVAQGFNVPFMYHTGGDYTYADDDGAIFPVEIYTPNYDAGTRRKKTLNAMLFNSDQVPGSRLAVRWNNNDFAPTKWSNFRYVDLSLEKPSLTGGGTFRRRSYHFRHQRSTPFRIRAVDLQLDIGTL